MSPEHKTFLTLTLMPARLDGEQAAWYLGFQPHDIAVLVAADLLRPLGHPRHNAVKYFATADLEALRSDSRWLAKATEAVQSRWRRKNGTDCSLARTPPRSRSTGRTDAPNPTFATGTREVRLSGCGAV